MAFGEKLKETRLALDLSQAELAEMTGLSERSLYTYEQLGIIPRAGNIRKIAEALGVSASFLMDEEGSADNGTAAGGGQIRSGVMGDIEAEFGKKGAREAREVLERAGALLAGGDLDDEAKDVFFQALMEVYLDSKRSAREKYSPAKYRASRRKKDGDSVQR